MPPDSHRDTPPRLDWHSIRPRSYQLAMATCRRCWRRFPHAAVRRTNSAAHGMCQRRDTVRSPVSVMDGRPLSNTVGPVLDPIFSLRTRVGVEPGATVHLAFATMVAQTREQVLGLADKYHDPATFERISMLAWTHVARISFHMTRRLNYHALHAFRPHGQSQRPSAPPFGVHGRARLPERTHVPP